MVRPGATLAGLVVVAVATQPTNLILRDPSSTHSHIVNKFLRAWTAPHPFVAYVLVSTRQHSSTTTTAEQNHTSRNYSSYIRAPRTSRTASSVSPPRTRSSTVSPLLCVYRSRRTQSVLEARNSSTAGHLHATQRAMLPLKHAHRSSTRAPARARDAQPHNRFCVRQARSARVRLVPLRQPTPLQAARRGHHRRCHAAARAARRAS